MLVSLIFLVSAVLSFAVGGIHGHIQRGRHKELAQRARGDVNKRAFDNSRFTFYDVGLGACGQYNSPGDFIVALNVAQFGGGYPGPHCFKSITIWYGGKTAQATIMDKCMGCPYGGLDFSTGLFSYFASENDGVVYGSWWFNDVTSGPADPKWTPTPVPRADPSTPTYIHYHHYAADTNTTSTLSTSETSTTSTSETPTTSATDTSTTSTSETPTTSLTGTSTTSTTETSTTSTTETLTTSLTGTSTTSTYSSSSTTPRFTAYVAPRV